MYDHATVISQLRSMVDWAIETGYHECGYDPVDTVKAEIERLRVFQSECLLPYEANDLQNDLAEARDEIAQLRAELERMFAWNCPTS